MAFLPQLEKIALKGVPRDTEVFHTFDVNFLELWKEIEYVRFKVPSIVPTL